MNSSTSPSPTESDKKVINGVLIERKIKNTENELLMSYDTKPLSTITENEEEKEILLKLINNILLSCNFSYLIYSSQKLFGYLKSLFSYNLFYFFVMTYVFKWIFKEKNNKEEEQVSFFKKLILFNLPELLLIFFYRKKKLQKTYNSIRFLFTYLNERIAYVFNNDSKNKFLCQINQNNYDIILIKKDGENIEDNKILYENNEEYLSKDTFFDSVIAYPNANFEDFDFNNLEKNEDKLFENIFDTINEIEKKVKEKYSFINNISTFVGNLSYSSSIKFNILYSLGYKLGGFIVHDIYLENYAFKSERKIYIEEKTKEFNQKHMEEGYFLTINDDIILLFRIKEKYKSFDESYSILYEDSQNLIKKYFN